MPIPLKFKNAFRDTTIILNSTVADQTFSFHLPFAADSLIFDPEIWTISKNTVIREPSYLFSFFIFPNPVESQLQMRIETFDSQNAEVKIYSETGDEVYSAKSFFHSGISDYTVDVKKLSAGVYHVLMNVWGKTFNSSFVKTNR